MSEPLRIVQVNLAYGVDLREPAELLDRYHTLTGWSFAVTAAGASVRVIQRFRKAALLRRDGIEYEFLADGGPPLLMANTSSPPVIRAVNAREADVVHINGLMFPAFVSDIRRVGPHTAIVVQDHAGLEPPLGSGMLERWRRRHYRLGLGEADAWSFTAAANAQPWRNVGILEQARVIEVVEASTDLTPMLRDQARAMTGLHGDPVVLWVGRLNGGKDPITALKGLEIAFEQVAGARGWMIYHDAPLERDVREFVAQSPSLRDRVVLLGRVPHPEMARYYSAADIFISASHREGSGYALIEAMACGVVPVVTDIPSHRTIAGDCGARWRVGDADACAAALSDVMARDLSIDRAMVHARFDRDLSWSAIGRRTVALYREIVETRPRR